MYRNYLITSLFGLISIVICFLWLPETKGKTVSAVQTQLRKTDDLVCTKARDRIKLLLVEVDVGAWR